MSIVKDCCLILSVVFMLLYYIKYCKIKNELFSQKSYFINTLSHDFRVSLIAQIRGLEILEKIVPKEALQLVIETSNSCKYSLDLVTTLMNIYKAENGENPLKFEYIKLSDIINPIWSNLIKYAENKGINLSIKSNYESIYADKICFSKAIEILIFTALMHANNRESVELDFKNINNKMMIYITYNGKPLSEEEYRRMFATNPTFSTVGHGLQMYFLKKIIELHNGKIELIMGKNSLNTFKIFLPEVI